MRGGNLSPSGVVSNEGFKQGGDLLLLAAGQLRSGLEKSAHLAGGTTTTTTYSFKQPPSGRDMANALSGTTNIVVGARDKKVYIYDSGGTRATFPLKQF